jgi:hypothetical protein
MVSSRPTGWMSHPSTYGRDSLQKPFAMSSLPSLDSGDPLHGLSPYTSAFSGRHWWTTLSNSSSAACSSSRYTQSSSTRSTGSSRTTSSLCSTSSTGSWPFPESQRCIQHLRHSRSRTTNPSRTRTRTTTSSSGL